MNIVTNERLIRRNAKIAQFTGLGGMVVLAAGMVVLFTRPESISIVWSTVIIGFILSQVGIYFTNRWGRRPRPDESITGALKGLGDNYTLYHYTTPTPHLLIGPAGIWVLLPRYQRGTITYQNGKWRQKSSGFVHGYLRLFGQEGIGRPDLEASAEVDSIKRFLKKNLSEEEIPSIQAALVFTDDRVTLDTDDAPLATLPVKKLKEFIRKTAKGKPIPTTRVKDIQQIFGPVKPTEISVENSEE
jgi:hypothetical protein